MRPASMLNFYPIFLKRSLLFFIVLLPSLVFSQIHPSVVRKFSPGLQRQAVTGKEPASVAVFMIALSDSIEFKSFSEKTPGVVYQYAPGRVLLVRASWKDIVEKIAWHKEVVFIDEQRIPKEEVAVSNLDISANKVAMLHSRFPQYTGESLTVSVKENRPDTVDIDFKGRYITTAFASPTLSSHATIMSTIIAGGGNTYYEGKGVATAATISSANFSTLLPEPDAAYQQYNISVQNHSYGTGIENFYGADASAYDASVITRPPLLHIFSAGNAGTQTSTTGPYTGIPGFANLTGSFKMAKNIITVGHTDSFGVVLAPSSRGPAYDGRVKPELVAFGEDGSSGAAAMVSGIALSLQHAWKSLHGVMPSAALIKAILLNSVDDAGTKGIDFMSGYGFANAFKAMRGLVNGRYFENSIGQGATNTHNLVVPPGIKQLKITLVWNDPPAMANAAKALRNDLDLELELPAASQLWQPWVLNHFPHIDSLQQLPVRKRDSLNNAEQITLDNPVAGNYNIHVNGFSVAVSSPQSYAIAYQLDSLDTFTWYYPTQKDNIFGGNTNVIRWESSYSSTTGQLEYSIDNGSSWQLISIAADLSKGYYKWNAPDTFVTALLRMNIASQVFVSDTFTISKRINTFVGFNCPDSFLFYWNKPRGVNSFRVYTLGNRYLEPLFITTDTFAVLSKNSNPSLFYTIAPVIGSKTGVKSYTFNYTTQGVECYIRSFLGSLLGNTAQLDLLLGTTYQINRIVLEKFDGNSYVTLQQLTSIPGLSINFTDNQLYRGLNTYRVKIVLNDGRTIYSQPETVYYFSNAEFIVYPNPVSQQQSIQILTANTSETIRLQVFNSMGQKVYESIINDLITTIPAGKLARGLYFFRFTRETGRDETMRVLVQ